MNYSFVDKHKAFSFIHGRLLRYIRLYVRLLYFVRGYLVMYRFRMALVPVCIFCIIISFAFLKECHLP